MQIISIEQLVPQEHFLRKVDKYIDFDFIYEEVEELYCLDNGRPSIDPVILVKILLIQCLYGIKSMRQTIKDIQVNTAYRWFLGYDLTDEIPHFTTYSKNYTRRFKGTNVFENIFSKVLMQAIEEACRVYDLDARNITLLGFSQGSILSMAVALSYPKKIRNVIALSGYLNKDIIKEGYESEHHSMTHFYISHGSSDQVIPVEWARQTPVILDSIDVKYRYEEFPVGHGVSPQNFYSFREWLTQQ